MNVWSDGSGADGPGRSGAEIGVEKDRFFSRLATIPGVRPMPSIGDWILLEVESPSELARKVNRRLEPGTMSVPRGVRGAVRIHVREPKVNEVLLTTLRDLAALREEEAASATEDVA